VEGPQRPIPGAGRRPAVRPGEPVADATQRADLVAAGNEFESFQVVVDARRPMRRVDVVLSGPLRGPGGATIPTRDVAFAREVGYEVGGSDQPPTSDIEGDEGTWPDALVPVRDEIYGERRNALPVDLARDERLAVWADVFVAPGTAPGAYRGTVVVSDSNGVRKRIPLEVGVLPFSLPSSASLSSSFGFEWTSVCLAHTGSESCNGDRELAWRLASLYTRVALEDRLTISDPSPIGRETAPEGEDLELFDEYIRPLVAGEAQPRRRLAGSRLTSIAAYWPCAFLNAENGCLDSWRRIAEADGFADRFFVYVCNEPEDRVESWEECRDASDIASERWPGVARLAAASLREALAYGGTEEDPDAALARLDVIAVLVNEIANMPGSGVDGNQRPSYEPFLRGAYGRAHGGEHRFWLYTSCQSYGCEGDDAAPLRFVGWPGYAIDQPPSEARAMGWLSFEYDADGELYYQTTSLLPDAWVDSYNYGGNGDGTLFYPGVPGGRGSIPAIGGRRPIPIESIRLKRIRDGREDYEYLRMLEEMGRGPEARKVVESVFGPPDSAMYEADVPEADLMAARARLARMIVAAGGG
jgi:hypothetical protein